MTDTHPLFQEAAPITEPQVIQEVPEQYETAPAVQETSKEANLRYLRERAEAAERRNMELEYAIKQQQFQQQQTQPQRPIHREEDDEDGDDDSYVEKKQLKSLKRELREKIRNVEEIGTKSIETIAHLKLQASYKDFDEVTSQANLEKLARLKPYVYRSMMANQDVYDRGATAYDTILNSGIFNKESNEIDKKLDAQRGKPRSSSTVSPQSSHSPMAKISDYDRRTMTKEEKNEMYKRAQSNMRK